MIKLIVFHSGSPTCTSCQTAIGVAKGLKARFSEFIDLQIHTNDSSEAGGYTLSESTTVFVDDVPVPLDIAMSRRRMEIYLRESFRA